MLRLLAALSVLALASLLAVSQENSDPVTQSDWKSVEQPNPVPAEIVPRQGQWVPNREDYAKAVSLFTLACRQSSPADCDHAYEEVEAHSGLKLPPNMQILLAREACIAGIKTECERLQNFIAEADHDCDTDSTPGCANALEGAVALEGDGQARSFGVYLSEAFDAEATRAMALEAEQGQDYAAAFQHFFAVCAAGHGPSCLDAAMLADIGIVEDIPAELIDHLYQQACAEGIDAACDLPVRFE
ncbi:MAG: hypothetical protein ACX94B_02010 [Henriciella sp.]